MHLHFIFPCWPKLLDDHPHLRNTLSGYDVGAFRMAGLGVATAAGAVPREHKVTLTDDNCEPLDYNLRPDLVCLSFFTPQATRAYEIADSYRSMGVPVVAGGIHPNMVPDETLEHCDSIVRGPAEALWDEILQDLSAGHLKRQYRGTSYEHFARPRWGLFKNSSYLQAGVVQTARGCGLSCPFCIIPNHAGKEYVFKPLEEVLASIRELPFPCFFFGDENLLFQDQVNREYSTKLFSAMIDQKVRHRSFMANYPNIVRRLDEDMISMLAKARMRQIYLIFGLKKPIGNEIEDERLLEAVLCMKKHGIEVLASFTLGNDAEEEGIEHSIFEYCNKTETNLVEFIINTPYPGTPYFEAMERDGRILHKNWEKYNGANAVFIPLHESPEELENRYLELWTRFYSRLTREEVCIRYVKGFGGNILRQNPS